MNSKTSADAQIYGLSGGIRGIRANWLNGLPNIATILDVCFQGATAPLFFTTTCDAADPACLPRVHGRAFRRISHLQTLDDGLNGLRLIWISAPKRTRFCKIISRTGRTTGARRRGDATASRHEKLNTIYHMKAILPQACRQTRRRRAL